MGRRAVSGAKDALSEQGGLAAKAAGKLSDRLTRIELNVDFQPEGLFEKLSSGLRFHRRAVRTDLQRFKAFVEMRNEPTGAWKGEIHEEEATRPGRPRRAATATPATSRAAAPRTASSGGSGAGSGRRRARGGSAAESGDAEPKGS